MQLHPHVQAHRRATETSHLRLSATLDTLPPGRTFTCTEIAPGHWLIIVRDGAEYDELAHAYAYAVDHGLPEWIPARIFGVLGVVSPGVDLAGYHHTRWWGIGWPLGPTAAHLLEEAGGDLITRWRHAWLN